MLVAMAIAAVLATLSYPSFQATVLRLRRAEAITALAALQLAQQRYRSNQNRYARLSELGLPGTSASGRYLYSEQEPDSLGFAVQAVAQGSQASDTLCAHLALQVSGLDVQWRSGPSPELSNTGSDNTRCWNQ